MMPTTIPPQATKETINGPMENNQKRRRRHLHPRTAGYWGNSDVDHLSL
jgi:hypothetical protein